MRNHRDYYATPALVAAQLAHVLTCADRALIAVDPCAGDNRLVRWLEHLGFEAFGFDIEPQHELVDKRDALDTAPWLASATVMNPPFSLAAAFIRRALAETPELVVALVRLTFLEPGGDRANRRDLLERGPDVYILPERPHFRADRATGDFATSAWLRWPGRGRITYLPKQAPEIHFLQEA